MKKQVLLRLLTLLLGTFWASAQTTLSCGQMFTDAEGPNLNYADSANVTTTICPTISGGQVLVSFNSFSTENNVDFLYVYDGTNTNAPLIGTYSGTMVPPDIMASNPTGCLTFVFTSNDSVNSAGWVAYIECLNNCPNIINLTSTLVDATTVALNWMDDMQSAGPWSLSVNGITTTLTSNPFYTISGLSPGTYTATVSSVCNASNGNAFTIAFIVPNPNTCAVPVQFSGGPDLLHTTMNLSWVEPGTATAWEVLAWPCNTAFPSANDQGTPVTTNSYTFTNLDPTQCYAFYVRSICSNSSYSDWSQPVHLFPVPTCPAVTTIQANSSTSTTANLYWTSSSTSATSWEVVALPCGTALNANTAGVIANTTSFQFSGLLPNTCYNLYVRAICSSVASDWSAPTNVTTLPNNNNPTPTCGSTFTDPGGATANYANSSNVTTVIAPSSPGQLVTINFTSFNLENNFDFLKIYDGDSASAPLLANLTGTAMPASYTASNQNGSLTFVFTSDSSVTAAGWVANITCAPAPICPMPAALTATGTTFNATTIGWTNNSSATSFEVIALPCGTPAPTTTTTGATTTSANPYTITGLTSSTCYTIYVRALCSADHISSWSSGLNVTTTVAPPACGGVFIDNGGATANYANSSDNTYVICPSNPSDVVTVTFTSFNTEATWDGLYVFNGNSTTSPQIASANPAGNVPGGVPGAFWGTTIPGPFTSSNPNGCLTFRFRSDGSVNNPGWVANVTCGPAPTCATPFALTATATTSNAVNIGWTNNSAATNFEVIALPCGTPAPTATTTGATTTSLNPYIITGLTPSTCYTIYVRALCAANDISAWSTGLNVTTTIAPPVCGGVFEDNGGANANYASSSDNTYVICPSTPGDVVTVTFTSFNTEAGWDGLYVFDGNSTTSPQITSANPASNVPGGLPGAFWGTTIPGPFTSSDPSGCLTFRFRSDASVNNPGWTANVTCGVAPDKLTLIAFIDANGNGTKDIGETQFSNGSFVYQLNDSGTNTYATSTTGVYSITDTDPTNSYDLSYEIQSEYVSYFSSGNSTHNNITIPVGSGNTILYFPITVIQTYNDVSVAIIPLSAPRPGLSYTNRIVYKNLGIAATSGTITFVKPTLVTVSTISQAGTVANTNGFTYNYTNLLPNETRIINVTMAVPPSPTVNLNNLLTDSASITSTGTTDINTNNNASTNSQIVVNSYDPNDKMESHGDKIPFNQFTQNDYLYYTIRFENEGTANAIDVKIEDILSPLIDAESIRMVGSSHNCVMKKEVNSHTVVWEFPNIQLVPTSQNADLGKGYVIFKVKLNPGFTVGTIVPNTAQIYFDTNPAIVTNTFNTKFTEALSTISFDSNNFVVYPNPANSLVQVILQNSSENIDQISLTDLLGKTVKTVRSIAATNATLDISDVAKGVYMIEITTENKIKQIKKLIIE